MKRIKVRLEPALAKVLARASKEVAKWPRWMRSPDVEEQRRRLKLPAVEEQRKRLQLPAEFLRNVHSESLRAVAQDIRRGVMPPLQCAALLERCADMIEAK